MIPSQMNSTAVSTKAFDLRLRRLHIPTEREIGAMMISLKERGQLSPVVAFEEEKRLVLTDGFKRQGAAEKLGLPTLLAVCVSTDSIRAKAMMYLSNRARGFSMIQEAMLVRELVDVDGLQQIEAARLLMRHKSWVNRRLNMIRRLSPETVNDLITGLVPPGSGPSLARLHACNQADVVSAVQEHRLEPMEIRGLVDLFCKTGEPDYKKFLLKSPREALNIVHGGRQIGKTLDLIERNAESLVRTSSLNRSWIESSPEEVETILNRVEQVCRTGFDAIRSVLKERK